MDMKTEVLFGSVQKRKKHRPLIEEGLKIREPSMASERKLRKKNSLRKSQREVSRATSFAKDEELEKILQDVETANKYNPSSKNAEKRPSVVDDAGLPPDEELDKFFVDVEKRNAELQELLQAVESTRDESDGQLSRITSAGKRGSTESLVEELMQELDGVDWEKENSNRTRERQKSSSKVSKKMAKCKLETSASEQELDQMLAELLEL